jgi:type II secretory ATPase GspE/PulE/Tfp pilus assembly ATPase PilB-like protein
VTPAIRKLIASRAATEAIHDAAVAEGMVDLKGYAAILLTEGLTTVEEVTSVVSVRD